MSSKHPRSFATSEELLKWYQNNSWFHNRLSQLIAHYLEWQVERYFTGINLPTLAKISWREKTITSLRLNLSKGNYGTFPIAREKITDLAGVRAVFYFSDDVHHFCDERARLFRTWFGIYADKSREVNTGVESTGWEGTSKDYRSWHYTVRVDPDTEFFKALSEMDKAFLTGLFCEVQLRTILQDAWAEANHDIRYKQKRHDNTRREKLAIDGFHRLADQLRSADEVLVELKHDYLLNVEENLHSEISTVMPNGLWRYELPRYNQAASIGGVDYGYELLDSGVIRGSAMPIRVVSSTQIFDVDKAMRDLTGVDSYKQSMWEQLRMTEAQFVVSIAYDSMVVRATGWNAAERTLSVELAAYSDQVVTNHKRVQNKLIPGDRAARTVRDVAVSKAGELLPFEFSPLSNTIGVSCVIKTTDDVWCIGLRSKAVAFDPGTWGCSASGALNWVELGHWSKRNFEGWFQNGIVREIEEELGFIPAADEIHYLAFAREFGRLGKPQVFFFVDAKIGCDSLHSKFRAYKGPTSEYQGLEFLDETKVLDLISADADRVNRWSAGANVNEELRFNLALALQFEGVVV